MSRFDFVPRRIGFALIVALVASLLASATSAAPAEPEVNATVSLVSGVPVVAGCGITRVEIWVSDIDGLNAADVRFTFDSTRLQVADADAAIPGTQIIPLGNFLKPDYVARKIACNEAEPGNPDCATAGFVWYAATQVAPSLPVSGSGPIAAVDFIAVASGVSPLTITYSKPVDINGTMLPAVLVDTQLTGQRPDSPVLSIRLQDETTAALSWSAVAAAGQYRLYRDTAPYFDPTDPAFETTTALTFDDVDAVGNPDENHFYTVKAGCSSGFASDASIRVGEFDFALLPGEATPIVP